MNNTPTPAVDIALATYNGEPYLPQLLKSIEKQEYGHWHLIAGDDGSTDQTTRILEGFADKHPNKTTILPAGKQQGTTANFSRTLQACRSCYVMPADQDDIWLSNKISTSLRCVRALEHQLPSDTPVLIHTDASVTDHQGRLIARSFWHHQNLSPKFGLKFKNLLVQNVITGCTMLTNRPLLDLALPIPPESILHDWWLGLTAAPSDKSIIFASQPSNTASMRRIRLGQKNGLPKPLHTKPHQASRLFKKELQPP